MANYLLIRHTVRDFSEWKKAYDADGPKRTEAGLTEEHLLRTADNPNQVVVLFQAQDVKKAQAFAGSEDLKQVMQSAGVVDRPDVYFLNG